VNDFIRKSSSIAAEDPLKAKIRFSILKYFFFFARNCLV